MQQLSFAYIKAVAAACDCAVELDSVDRDSIDLSLKWKSNAGPIRSPRLEVQAKATHRQCIGPASVAFRLKRKNYDELNAANYAVPRVLVVFVMPRNIEDWLSHTEDKLALRRCAYWVSLVGLPAIGPRQSAMVQIPRAQRFDVDGLDGIYRRLSLGIRP